MTSGYCQFPRPLKKTLVEPLHYSSLALDTSGKACSIALTYNGRLYESSEEIERQQAKYILPRINSLLQQSKLTLKQLDFIAFCAGPGSFTGIRLAASIVQGLAFGANLPVIPVSTLQAIAQTAYNIYRAAQIVVAINAYAGKIYWGVYKISEGHMLPMFPDSMCSPEAAFLPNADSSQWIGVGDGWRAYPGLFRKEIGIQSICDNLQYPKAKDIVYLAQSDYKAGKHVSAQQALPLYLYGADCWSKPKVEVLRSALTAGNPPN